MTEILDTNSGRVMDFISGILVPAKPEEVYTTQPMAKQLVADYLYPKEHIITRPQFMVKKSPSDKRGAYPVDIAIFGNENKQRDDLYIVVECKKPGELPELGQDRQIFNYMRLSSAQYGIWTNGEERQFFRKVVKNDHVEFESITNIPRYGESFASIGKYFRKDLRAPSELVTTFKAIRNHLAANAIGTTRDETIANQMIILILCKIYDERNTLPDAQVSFRIAPDEDAEVAKQRITGLFNRVKDKYNDVITADDTLILDPQSLRYVIGELGPYAITLAPRDVVAQAFEVFIGETLKGAQGQFFTPRNVIELMIKIISPPPPRLWLLIQLAVQVVSLQKH